MKTIINNKIFDTEKSTKISEYDVGVMGVKDYIFRTQKGQYYKVDETFDRNGNDAIDAKILDKDEVLEYLVEWDDVDTIQKLFPNALEEA